VGDNDLKQSLIPEGERVDLIKEVVVSFKNVEVHSFSGLLVDFAKQSGASLILRGIRNGTDCDFEQQLAHMNRTMSPTIDTIFMLPSANVQAIASTLVRTIVRAGGDVSAFVPKAVVLALAKSGA
ncbi:MAG: pantetheine-phosphate adenylyltransferase, partial [Pseudomonadota bacterium]|nr:pantetheine-phosphate adenylyltransferase [Pseudomonadota bacterium]